MKSLVICLVLHLHPALVSHQRNAGTFSAFSTFHPASQPDIYSCEQDTAQPDSGLQPGLDTLFNTDADGLGVGGAGFAGGDANTGAFDVFAAATGEKDVPGELSCFSK